MKLVEDCWDQIDTYNCQYGAHVFVDSTAKIYVNHWLATNGELDKLFYRKNDEGFVGHCILVFYGVKVFDLVVRGWFVRDGETVWENPVEFHYEGDAKTGTTKYEFEGSLHGFGSSVSITIEAQRFALQILGKDEPASQS